MVVLMAYRYVYCSDCYGEGHDHTVIKVGSLEECEALQKLLEYEEDILRSGYEFKRDWIKQNPIPVFRKKKMPRSPKLGDSDQEMRKLIEQAETAKVWNKEQEAKQKLAETKQLKECEAALALARKNLPKRNWRYSYGEGEWRYSILSPVEGVE